ncbi:uncharacterized protein N7443_008661 [Penicillium atrosanguineum]|uniref:uncharacterized protein n=1 Tax=Penicillium atrosanguineum TaxID=1132637 RepID=UPI002391C236|nr:uncharacterized protein N7443_008661 [Penicillium atrosanguineum]KAJ5292708.1 hypothetical protein N7443_008661 [Penicillium atrosanguineum]
MAYTTSYDGSNYGFQVGQNLGHITNQFLQPETLNQVCLRDLRTTDPHHDKDRIQNTNGGLLKDSYCWVLDNEEFQRWRDNQNNSVLWIRGDPGKGKTMLLCGIIDELTRLSGDTANILFFFCQATDVRINNATAVLRGLIFSLVEKQLSLLSHVQRQYDKAGKSLFEDINAWNALLGIFTDIIKDPTLRSTYLIIDALDECTIGLPSLLDLITQISSTYPQIKWIVSSRNWLDIEERLGTTQTAPISLELNEASVSEAVSKFIQHKVQYLAKVKKYSDETRDMICRYLSSNSQGTFLWVALVCQDLDRTSRRLALKKLEVFPPGLNALYARMIDQISKSEDVELCKRILAVMSTVYRPISFDELASLVELPDGLSNDSEGLSEIIAICGSFLTVRDDTIIFVHQSAKEFLLRETQNGVFPRGIEAEHRGIFSRSLQAMFKTLRRDIFHLKFPGFPIEKVIPPSPNPLATAKYACVYWVDHLLFSGCHERKELNVDESGCIGEFLQKKYLHWLEALSILGGLSQGIVAMLKLDALLQEKGQPADILHLVQDASRFIRYHRLAIESSPLQVYSSSLIFSPMLSLVRMCYQREKPDWLLKEPVVDQDWSSCLQTLEGHSDSVTSTAWSQDGSRLASASKDETVRIWDPATGQCALALEGHSGWVTSIAWSQDGSRLASASEDTIVKIWDLATGQCALTFEGHSDSVTLIAWSQDGSRLASASKDKTVRIWDPATSQCALTLEGHSGWVTSIAWSQDGSRLASASQDKTVRIWDPATGQCVSTLEGHRDSVTLIAWSQDGSRLASASEDSTVRIWDPATGQCGLTLEGHIGWIHSISWSQDGSRLASASYHIIKIWDSATGQCALALEGHSTSVFSIAWSQDGSRLASASKDKTVRIWDPATGQCVSTLEGHSDSVNSIAWSQDGSRLASASSDSNVRIWDPATGQCASTLEGHSELVTSIAWSQDGSRLASASEDCTVRIWDPATGQCGLPLRGHTNSVTSITWSQDGNRLASAGHDSTVRIWDPATSQCALTLGGHNGWVTSIAWSQDGSRLASAPEDSIIRIWDIATGQCALTLKGHSGWVSSIAWSQDGSRLASASEDTTVRIWDPATGQCALTLEGQSGWINLIAWSQDGSRLASASEDGTIRIWDPDTGHCESTLHISSPYFLQFDEVNFNHLHTSYGTFDIGFTGPVTSIPHCSTLPEQHGYGLNDDHSWITYNGVNLLWLPDEYRPSGSSLFAMSTTNLAIACSSGLVKFYAVTEQSPIPGL